MLTHARSGVRAVPDATVTHPDGKLLVRLNDQWFFRADCKEAS